MAGLQENMPINCVCSEIYIKAMCYYCIKQSVVGHIIMHLQNCDGLTL